MEKMNDSSFEAYLNKLHEEIERREIEKVFIKAREEKDRKDKEV